MQTTAELVAGRELDELIAEKVMDIVVLHNPGVVAPDPVSGPPLLAYKVDPWTIKVLPHYSTDIAAAWQVVTIATEFELWFNPDQQHWGGYIAFGDDEFGRVTDCDTAPLAICRAALAAVSQ
jgi:hypothetical protein